MKATYELTTNEGMVKAFNAQSSTTGSVKDLAKLDSFEINDILVYSDEKVDESTGELVKSNITVFYGTDGILYGGNSASVFSESSKLIDMLNTMKHDINKKPIKLGINASESKNGRTFMQLKIVSL